MVKLFLASIFVLFSYLQYNDTDSYIWTSLYLLVALFIFLEGDFMYYLNSLILAFCSILFISNIHSLLTKPLLDGELFYELGGILLILTVSYFKLKKQI